MAGRWANSYNGRGRFAGRGRGSWHGPGKRPAAAVTELNAPELGSLLATITKSDLINQNPMDLPRITDCKLVGTYNWLSRKSPTILVPGAPPKWTPVSKPNKLPEDSGSYYRDQNAARYAVHVFQPAVEAVLKHNAEFNFSEIDVVACGSTLGNLRRFISEPDKGFRFIVEAIGSTVFLVRRENTPTQMLSGVYGYGHTFPEANTTWTPDVKGSESHQRILKYRFAGLSCLFRYEGDGYLPDLHNRSVLSEKSMQNNPEDLVDAFKSATVSSVLSDAKQALTIEAGGEIIPQSAMFDLKTRTARKEYTDVLKAEIPRLWLAQIPNFVVGFHNHGVFNDVRVKDVRAEVCQWEEEHQSDLEKLAVLLRMLIAFAHGQPDGRFEVVFKGGHGSLELREVGGDVSCCISESMRKRWVEGACSHANSEKDGMSKGSGRQEMQEKKDEEESEEGEGEEDGSWEERDENSESSEPGGVTLDSEKDYTACSADCGYCGHCSY